MGSTHRTSLESGQGTDKGTDEEFRMPISCSFSKYCLPPGQGWGHRGECHLTAAEGWGSRLPPASLSPRVG